MGYYTRFTGGIYFNRDLTPKETKAIDMDDYYDIDLETEVITVDTTELGPVAAQVAVGIVPRSDDSIKGYYFGEHLQKVIDQLPEDVQLHGYIRAEGEESGDIHRYVVDGRQVMNEKAKLTWPDGTTESGR